MRGRRGPPFVAIRLVILRRPHGVHEGSHSHALRNDALQDRFYARSYHALLAHFSMVADAARKRAAVWVHAGPDGVGWEVGGRAALGGRGLNQARDPSGLVSRRHRPQQYLSHLPHPKYGPGRLRRVAAVGMQGNACRFRGPDLAGRHALQGCVPARSLREAGIKRAGQDLFRPVAAACRAELPGRWCPRRRHF